jgi:hypothetical protein
LPAPSLTYSSHFHPAELQLRLHPSSFMAGGFGFCG